MGDSTGHRWSRRLMGGLAAAGMCMAVAGVGATTAGATKPDANGVHKVTICHRTNSDTNPYVEITVDYSAVNGSMGKGNSDHTHHDGPVWSPGLKADHIKWGDIIPAYSYAGGTFPGLNADTGEAILANHCGIPDDTVEPCPYDPSIPADDPTCRPPNN